MRIAPRLAVTLLLAVAISRWAAAQSATPGPAARMGAAVDSAYADVRGEVAEAALWTRVRLALLENLKSEGLRVSIEVKGDRVTLAGLVGTKRSRERAGELARGVAGVREVTNHVQVGPEEGATSFAGTLAQAERDVSDGLVLAKVKARLLDELGRVGFGIGVAVSDGVVTLSGQVPDATRRRLAVEIASRVSGVRKVLDLLRTAA
jgi:hyperosmotically inducible periplasmic protein